MCRASWSISLSDWRATLLLAVAALALSGCGFRMQGATSFPEVLATSHVAAADRYTEFYRGLRAELEQGDVEVVESVVAASAVIRIEQDTTGQTVLTVSGRNVPTEYEVFYTVRYSVWIDGREVLPPRTLTALQDYTYDATLVLGKRREEETIRAALAAELVRQVAQQLSRL